MTGTQVDGCSADIVPFPAARRIGFIRKMVPLMAILSARRCRASASCAARCDTVSDAPPCSRL